MPETITTRREVILISGCAIASGLLASCNSQPEPVLPAEVAAAKPSTLAKTKSIPPEHTHTTVETSESRGFKLLTPTSSGADYEKYRGGFNRRVSSHPKGIGICTNTEEVAAAVKYARTKSLRVAVRSGGHSFEGFSSNNDGLVVNLSAMNSVEILQGNTVKIEPGCTLSKLYDTLLPRGKLVPGGSCGGVGVGGLALGGGYGFFARKYGLTCDNLKDLTLVDGSGEVHSSKSDPELLWACRGGGTGGLGIVTEMVFETHPVPKSFHSYRFKVGGLTSATAVKILKKWFEVANALPNTCFSAFVLNGKSLVILITDFESPTDSLQEALSAIGNLAKMTGKGAPMPLAKALKIYYGRRDPLYFKNASAGLYHSFDDIKGCISEVLQTVTTTPGLMYQVNTVGGAISNPKFETVSCFPHRSRPFLSELQAYYNGPGHESRLFSGFETVQKQFERNGITAHYANYPSLGFKSWQQSYYGDNYPRLQAVKRKYDPENRFGFAQGIEI